MDRINQYNRARLDDRQIDELVGLSRGLTVDGRITQEEAEFLHDWLVSNSHISENALVNRLYSRVSAMLSDGVLSDKESAELLATLNEFSGGDFEVGELMKSSTLPLDKPIPDIKFDGRRFAFTGNFVFGSRKECEQAVTDLGATTGGIAKKTDFLIIGAYASDSWIHSSYGRKIESAMRFKDQGASIAIVSELAWAEYL